MKLRDVAEKVLKTTDGVIAIHRKALHGMSACLLTRGSAARKDGFMFPCSGFQNIVFEERDGKERNVVQCFYPVDIEAQMVDIVPVNGIVLCLKMKEL